MEEEEKGFVIRDRRGRDAEGQEAPASEHSPTPQSQETQAGQETEPRLPPSFLSLVYSLGTSALMLLG